MLFKYAYVNSHREQQTVACAVDGSHAEIERDPRELQMFHEAERFCQSSLCEKQQMINTEVHVKAYS